MALSIKANAEDLPSIFQILGLSQPPPVDSSIAGAPPDQPDTSAPSQPQSVPTKLGRLQQIIQASQGNTDSPAITDQHNSPSVTSPDVSAATPSGAPVDMSAQMHKPSFLRQLPVDTGDASGGFPMGPEPANVAAPPLNVGTGQVLPPDLTQADGGRPQLQKTWAQEHPGLAKILKIGLGAAQGAGAGAGSWTFGEGYQKASELPLDIASKKLGLQQQAAQISNLPWQRAALVAGLKKTQAETDAESAKANKDTAEAGAIPTKTALEKVQAEAANFKEDPNLGLIDIRTGKPVAGDAGQAPLSADEAPIVGKQVGDKVPLKIKNMANEMFNRGVRSVSANGRSLLVDNKGNTIKDMGVATPMAVIDKTNPMADSPTSPAPSADGTIPTGEGTLKGFTPQQAAIIRGIGGYDLDPKRYMTPRNAAAGAQLMAAVKAYNPQYDDTAFTEKNRLRKDIATQSMAFNTATHHLDLLNQAVDALGNHNMAALNALGNAYHTQMGDSEVNNFEAIKSAVVGELSKAFKGGMATDPEIAQQSKNLSSSSSPKILHDAINNYIKLMQGRLDGLEEAYEGQIGMKPNFQIVSPRTQQILARASAGTKPPTTGTAGTPPPNIPAHVQERDKKLGVVY